MTSMWVDAPDDGPIWDLLPYSVDVLYSDDIEYYNADTDEWSEVPPAYYAGAIQENQISWESNLESPGGQAGRATGPDGERVVWRTPTGEASNISRHLTPRLRTVEGSPEAHAYGPLIGGVTDTFDFVVGDPLGPTFEIPGHTAVHACELLDEGVQLSLADRVFPLRDGETFEIPSNECLTIDEVTIVTPSESASTTDAWRVQASELIMSDSVLRVSAETSHDNSSFSRVYESDVVPVEGFRDEVQVEQSPSTISFGDELLFEATYSDSSCDAAYVWNVTGGTSEAQAELRAQINLTHGPDSAPSPARGSLAISIDDDVLISHYSDGSRMRPSTAIAVSAEMIVGSDTFAATSESIPIDVENLLPIWSFYDVIPLWSFDNVRCIDASDPDGGATTVEWELIYVPRDSSLTLGQIFEHECIPHESLHEPGRYEFAYTVTDNEGEEASEGLTLPVHFDVKADPIAEIAPIAPLRARAHIIFDGRESFDPDNGVHDTQDGQVDLGDGIVRYEWTVVSRLIRGEFGYETDPSIAFEPIGSVSTAYELEPGRLQAVGGFGEGRWTVRLTVTDDEGSEASTDVVVDVGAGADPVAVTAGLLVREVVPATAGAYVLRPGTGPLGLDGSASFDPDGSQSPETASTKGISETHTHWQLVSGPCPVPSPLIVGITVPFLSTSDTIEPGCLGSYHFLLTVGDDDDPTRYDSAPLQVILTTGCTEGVCLLGPTSDAPAIVDRAAGMRVDIGYMVDPLLVAGPAAPCRGGCRLEAVLSGPTHVEEEDRLKWRFTVPDAPGPDFVTAWGSTILARARRPDGSWSEPDRGDYDLQIDVLTAAGLRVAGSPPETGVRAVRVEPCADDMECPGDHICNDGVCLPNECHTSDDCPPPRTCVPVASDPDAPPGECVPRECAESADCTGEVCSDGVCVPAPPTGNPSVRIALHELRAGEEAPELPGLSPTFDGETHAVWVLYEVMGDVRTELRRSDVLTLPDGAATVRPDIDFVVGPTEERNAAGQYEVALEYRRATASSSSSAIEATFAMVLWDLRILVDRDNDNSYDAAGPELVLGFGRWENAYEGEWLDDYYPLPDSWSGSRTVGIDTCCTSDELGPCEGPAPDACPSIGLGRASYTLREEDPVRGNFLGWDPERFVVELIDPTLDVTESHVTVETVGLDGVLDPSNEVTITAVPDAPGTFRSAPQLLVSGAPPSSLAGLEHVDAAPWPDGPGDANPFASAPHPPNHALPGEVRPPPVDATNKCSSGDCDRCANCSGTKLICSEDYRRRVIYERQVLETAGTCSCEWVQTSEVDCPVGWSCVHPEDASDASCLPIDHLEPAGFAPSSPWMAEVFPDDELPFDTDESPLDQTHLATVGSHVRVTVGGSGPLTAPVCEVRDELYSTALPGSGQVVVDDEHPARTAAAIFLDIVVLLEPYRDSFCYVPSDSGTGVSCSPWRGCLRRCRSSDFNTEDRNPYAQYHDGGANYVDEPEDAGWGFTWDDEFFCDDDDNDGMPDDRDEDTDPRCQNHVHDPGEPSDEFIDYSNAGYVQVPGGEPAHVARGPVISDHELRTAVLRAGWSWAQACVDVRVRRVRVIEVDRDACNRESHSSFSRPDDIHWEPVLEPHLECLRTNLEPAEPSDILVAFVGEIGSRSGRTVLATAIHPVAAIRLGGEHLDRTLVGLGTHPSTHGLSRRTLAHEIAHILTNRNDGPYSGGVTGGCLVSAAGGQSYTPAPLIFPTCGGGALQPLLVDTGEVGSTWRYDRRLRWNDGVRRSRTIRADSAPLYPGCSVASVDDVLHCAEGNINLQRFIE